MVHFNKIFGLVGAVVVFTGVSYGQNTSCGAPVTANPGLIRVEGVTEQVADLTFTCTAGTGTTTINILDILSLPVTSKILTSSTSTSEALAIVFLPNGTAYSLTQGVVSGSQISFANIVLPAMTATTITLTNVRVNASSLTVGTGTPPAVTESAFISGASFTASVIPATAVAYAFTGLSPVKLYTNVATASTPSTMAAAGTAATFGNKGAASFVVCQPQNKTTTNAGAFAVIDVGENFPSAFKAQGSALIDNAVGSEFTNNTETGFVPTAAFGNVANSGTLLQISLTNIPANLSVYAPLTVTADQAAPANATLGTLTLVTSATGTITNATAASSSSTVSSANGAIAVSNGSGVVYYQFTPGSASTTTTETFGITLFQVSSANTITPSTTPISAAVSFAPVGATNTIPTFVVGPSTVTQTLSTFSGCTTSLLFPFVSNQLGFDTGIAIANTSTDPFGTNGATPQQGTCTMSFYGNGAPSPASITTAVVPTGTVYTTVLSSIAAGFQGYAIAQCQFQYAHGFAFVEDGVGPTGGLSQGYLAGVIPDVNQLKGRPANPSSSAGAGTGETLGN